MIYQDDRYIKFQAEHEGAEIIQAGGMPLLLKDGQAFTPNNSYGGPLNSGFSYEQFIQDLKQVGVASYKIRFSPWLDNYKYFLDNKTKYSRQTIARDLTQSIKFGHGTEWAIKQSKKDALFSLSIDYYPYKGCLARFQHYYDLNMKKLKSELCYRYSLNYFKKLFDSLKRNIVFIQAMHDSSLVAAGIFLYDDKVMHYHFSATNPDYKKLYPMEKILFEAVQWGTKNNLKLIHFGGGLQDNDSLFQFKQKFGNQILEYYTAEGTV